MSGVAAGSGTAQRQAANAMAATMAAAAQPRPTTDAQDPQARALAATTRARRTGRPLMSGTPLGGDQSTLGSAS